MRTLEQGASAIVGAPSQMPLLYRALNIHQRTNVYYTASATDTQALDLYRPNRGLRDETQRLPVVLYIHGGGFTRFSKNSHWPIGALMAKQGYLVACINYRLAPKHRFPAALEDACHALLYVIEHAHSWGGDPGRLVLAGESAGANLVAALAIIMAYPRPETYTRDLHLARPAIRAVVAACGLFQVSNPERLGTKVPRVIMDRITEITASYLPRPSRGKTESLDLADPLLFLEQDVPPPRTLPPFFLPVGEKDPLLDDTKRMVSALSKLGVPVESQIYEGEPHAFQTLMWRSAARRCWRDTFDFIERHVSLSSDATSDHQ